MPNSIQFTTISPSKFVDPTSRYNQSTVVYYTDLNKITFTTYKKQQYVPNGTEKVATIGPGEEFRPDKMSNRIYGMPHFWWKILEANNMMDIYDFKSGVTVILPNNVL